MKNTLILTTSGSRNSNALESFNNIKSSYQTLFPNHKIKWFFTSDFIRKKAADISISKNEFLKLLNKHTIKTKTIDAIYSYHICNSNNFNSLKKYTKNRDKSLYIGSPLLNNPEKVSNIYSDFLSKYHKNNEIFFLIAHGDNNDICEFQFSEFLKHLSININSVHLITFHGKREYKHYLHKLNIRNSNCVLLPFMLNSGKHVRFEINGNSTDSIKSILKEKNNTVQFLDYPLSQISTILQYWLSENLKRAIH